MLKQRDRVVEFRLLRQQVAERQSPGIVRVVGLTPSSKRRLERLWPVKRNQQPELLRLPIGRFVLAPNAAVVVLEQPIGQFRFGIRPRRQIRQRRQVPVPQNQLHTGHRLFNINRLRHRADVLPRLGFDFVEFALKLHVEVCPLHDQPGPKFIPVLVLLLQQPVSNGLARLPQRVLSLVSQLGPRELLLVFHGRHRRIITRLHHPVVQPIKRV